ncbi:MAG: fatty acid desaturase [Myxococcaceae bacterium]
MTVHPALSFDRVSYPEPHLERTRTLLRTHPEVRELFGREPWSAFWVLFLVGTQLLAAWALRAQPVWLLLAAAWLGGAFVVHGLWVLIHDSTHNLVFRRARDNAVLQIFAGLPIIFPAAIPFRKYHLLHHRFQGDPDLDADLAGPLEARLVGNGAVRKALWLFTFWAWQAARVPRLKRIKIWDAWYVANLLVQVAFVAAVLGAFGWRSLLYLFMSSVFAIGLHPVGARWIQEHYLTTEGPQETFSYYGPLNRIAFNVGYHNEHHDLMMVPWSRLPKLKAIAPELYEPLYAHRSWTRLGLRFIFDPSLSLYSRRLRGSAAPVTEERPADRAFTEAITIAAREQVQSV